MTSEKKGAITILKMQGMSDSGQALRLRRAAAKLDGVFRVDINYILDSVTVKYDADKLTSAQVKKKLALGSQADGMDQSDSGEEPKER
jgi:copper chaperone CopZ